jgi:hypothetical protein
MIDAAHPVATQAQGQLYLTGACDAIRSNGGFPLVVVCQDPSDVPQKYSARVWTVGEGTMSATGVAIASDHYELLAACMPEGLVRIARQDGDDPVILETWV